eukprot:TRINITY_DN3557_c0_g1_i2.p1 TRINITY_DN3557_c0_g1~~TRINITY_DN3557_c0_g1_i2.p1  ORF type:complete len:367 (-),score=67.77 TRINITY_DN3557_c0_g1_i2:111-1211(-)
MGFSRSASSRSGSSSGSRFGSSRSGSGSSTSRRSSGGFGNRRSSSGSTGSSSGSRFGNRRSSGGSTSGGSRFGSSRTSRSSSTSSSTRSGFGNRRSSGGFSSNRREGGSRFGNRGGDRDEKEERGFSRNAQPVDPTGIFKSTTEQYDISHPDCKFQAFFYNRPDKMYIPECPDHINKNLWLLIQKSNPNKEKYIPVEIRGFKQLHERVNTQRVRCKEHQILLAKVGTSLNEMKEKHGIITTKIVAAKQRQIEILHRVIGISKQMEVLRAKGLPISAMEEEFQQRIQFIYQELQRPNMFGSRVRELKSVVRTREDRSAENYKVLDEDDMHNVTEYLSEQLLGISRLLKVVKQDQSDVKTMLNLYSNQ